MSGAALPVGEASAARLNARTLVRALRPRQWTKNLAVYAPDLRGVEVALQVRNLLGVREEVPTQEDYDRTDPDELLVPVLPGQGRELHASMAIRY